MWWNLDILKFGLLLLPPALRKKRTFAFLCALLAALADLKGRFVEYRSRCDAKLQVNGQVIYIEKALNDRFFLENRDIYITERDVSDIPPIVWLFNGASPEVYLYGEGDANVTWLGEGGQNNTMAYIVNVPSYLEGNLNEIRDLVEFYKPAGRKYIINIYEL